MLEAGWQGSPGIHGKCLPAMIRLFGRLLNDTFGSRNPESKFVTKTHGFPAMICLFGWTVERSNQSWLGPWLDPDLIFIKSASMIICWIQFWINIYTLFLFIIGLWCQLHFTFISLLWVKEVFLLHLQFFRPYVFGEASSGFCRTGSRNGVGFKENNFVIFKRFWNVHSLGHADFLRRHDITYSLTPERFLKGSM